MSPAGLLWATGGGPASLKKELTISGESFPNPVCSGVCESGSRSLWTDGPLGCGRTPRAVAQIPQITSVDPGRPGSLRDCVRQQRAKPRGRVGWWSDSDIRSPSGSHVCECL